MQETHGPLVPMSTCASSTLLMVISWVSSSLRESPIRISPCHLLTIAVVLLYLFGLIGVTSAHSSSLADVWGAAVTAVPWFEMTQRPGSSTSGRTLFDRKDPERQDYESPVFKDDESLYSEESSKPQLNWKPAGFIRPSLTAISISAPFSKSMESFRPQWAKDVKPRRGVDAPFLAPSNSQKSAAPRMKSHWSSTTASTYSPPVVPPKTRSPLGRQRSGDTMVEIPSEMSLPVISPSPSRPISYGIFPEDVQDPDKPIKPCHRSEWIRADSESR